jgi:methionine-rich copper-binding protein CopC
MRHLTLCVLLLVAPLSSLNAAAPVHMLESSPAAGTVMNGESTGFFVRFDTPVDHRTSRLFIAQNGHVLLTLQPRLDSAPDTLFARVGRLTPGDYELSWIARLGTGEDIGGVVPFKVGAAEKP